MRAAPDACRTRSTSPAGRRVGHLCPPPRSASVAPVGCSRLCPRSPRAGSQRLSECLPRRSVVPRLASLNRGVLPAPIEQRWSSTGQDDVLDLSEEHGVIGHVDCALDTAVEMSYGSAEHWDPLPSTSYLRGTTVSLEKFGLARGSSRSRGFDLVLTQDAHAEAALFTYGAGACGAIAKRDQKHRGTRRHGAAGTDRHSPGALIEHRHDYDHARGEMAHRFPKGISELDAVL